MFIIILYNFVKFLFLYTGGLFLSFVFISYYHYKDLKLSRIEELKELIEENNNYQFMDLYKEKIIFLKNGNLEDESSNEDEVVEIQHESYNIIQKDKPDNEDEFNNFFINEYVTMTSPLHGDIIMNYDNENNIFNYYCNRKDIPYTILDVVCRKYVLTYNIVDKYYINFTHNYENTEEIEEENLSHNSNNEEQEISDEEFKNLSDDDKENEKKECETNKNPFYKMQKKFEEYNKKTTVYDKKINVFKYKGNLIDYESTIKNNNNNTESFNKNMNYSNFKLLSQKQKDD